MSTSVIQLCNQALSEIGTRSNISALDDGSVEGTQCAIWYNTLRRRLLRTAPWGFARGQLALTQLGDLIPDQTAPYPWLWKYAYPSDCIKMRYVLPPPVPAQTGNTSNPATGAPFYGNLWCGPSRAYRYLPANDLDAEGAQRTVLLSNVAGALGVYTRDVIDPSLFDDLFQGALASALAYKLVISLSGNVGQRDEFKKSAEDAILQARVADGNESIPTSDIRVDWIETRGVGYGAFSAPSVGAGGGWGQWNCSWDSMTWGM